MYETSLAGRIFARNRKSAYFFPPEAFTGGFFEFASLTAVRAIASGGSPPRSSRSITATERSTLPA